MFRFSLSHQETVSSVAWTTSTHFGALPILSGEDAKPLATHPSPFPTAASATAIEFVECHPKLDLVALACENRLSFHRLSTGALVHLGSCCMRQKQHQIIHMPFAPRKKIQFGSSIRYIVLPYCKKNTKSVVSKLFSYSSYFDSSLNLRRAGLSRSAQRAPARPHHVRTVRTVRHLPGHWRHRQVCAPVGAVLSAASGECSTCTAAAGSEKKHHKYYNRSKTIETK